MITDEGVRIDKWLWAVRIYKTRSMATVACKKGRIMINDTQVKPSRIVKSGEIVMVRILPVVYTLKVVKSIDKRVAAKIAVECYENLTPDEELQKIMAANDTFFVKRDKGLGRPTKKERRLLDDLRNTN